MDAPPTQPVGLGSLIDVHPSYFYSVVEQELAAVEQDPEDVGQGGFFVAGCAPLLHVAEEPAEFLFTGKAGKGGEKQCLDALAVVKEGELGGRGHRRALFQISGSGDERAIHHR